MLLVRDVLDKQLLDRQGNKMGKVDGLVLERGTEGPPRVLYLEVGSVTLAHRLGARMGHWASRLAHRLADVHAESYRIPWTRVRGVTLEVTVDEAEEETRGNVVERWLRRHVVERIPGSHR
jgi:sporulation protein YlmC with PRC-barrel domain